MILNLLMFLCAIALPAAAQQPESDEKTPPPRQAAVKALLAAKPSTPAECVRAAKILAELERPDLAKQYIKKVLAANLDAQRLAELGRRLGEATFIELAGREPLLPEARKLADAVAAAIRAQTKDLERIEELIRQLNDPSPEQRLRAIIGLQAAGRAAIPPLVAVLADGDRADRWPDVRAALVEIGEATIDPMMAVVAGADPKLAVQAIKVLAAAGEKKAVPCLLAACLSEDGDQSVRAAAAVALVRLIGGVPSRDRAVALLSDEARAYLNRSRPIDATAEGKVRLWRWDESKRQLKYRMVFASEAARTLAARWARAAYSLAPHRRRLRLPHLTAMLEAAAHENGLDRPLEEKNPAVVEAERFGVDALEEVLQYAMAEGHTAAATAAARILGRIGSADELLYRAAVPAAAKQPMPAAAKQPMPASAKRSLPPLVEALRSPDRRLRLAAAEAIVRLQPIRRFAGSSYVVDALGFLAAGRGVRGALAASPRPQVARDLAGRLGAAGYRADAVQIGRDLLLRAARSPDCELVLIDVTIDRPTAATLLQQLRHDRRTAWLPVGLIAPAGHYDRAKRIARDDLMAADFPRPRDDRAVDWQLERLRELAPQRFVDLEARQWQTARALDLLDDIARTSEKLYDPRRVEESATAALANPHPAIAARAAEVLGAINSASAQRALVDLAARFARPLTLRQTAAKAFRESVQRHGILLTTDEIQRQYDVFNRSREQNDESRKVLSLVLDTIEAAADSH